MLIRVDVRIIGERDFEKASSNIAASDIFGHDNWQNDVDKHKQKKARYGKRHDAIII